MYETLAIALGGSVVTITTVVALYVQGKRASDAERRAGEYATKLAVSEANGTRLTERLAEQSKLTDHHKERADGAERLYTELLDSLPDDFARARLHEEWAKRRTAATDQGASDAVPQDGAAVPPSPGPDDLLRPGD